MDKDNNKYENFSMENAKEWGAFRDDSISMEDALEAAEFETPEEKEYVYGKIE